TGTSFPNGSQSTYSVRIRTTDSGDGNLTFEKSFTITVDNFAPSDISLSDTTVPGAPGETVGTFSTTDTETDQTYTYALVTGDGDADNSLFTISGDTLTTASGFPNGSQGTYSVRVRT